ncbi:MAG: SDR family NAD(P)-dependent oxidoreductase [Verrucomicrobiaceae bacterium]|nr:MAG: SDR family NAD(P)-dependent oxidoreductase [Verrucomicrobiaceae bacterium]
MRKLAISLQDSQAFARLSGDFNPLHVDPVAARRLQFGACVVHGVHVSLAMLEEAARQDLFDEDQIYLKETVLQFDTPLRSGQAFEVAVSKAGDRIEATASVDGRILQRATFVAGAGNRGVVPLDRPFGVAAAEEYTFEQMDSALGTAELALDRVISSELFPALAGGRFSPHQFATMLASTRIVGMQRPGLHSVFTGLKLIFDSAGEAEGALRWRISKTDRRFHLVTISLEGAAGGDISAIVRSAPMQQATYRDIKRQTRDGARRGKRALVIGGSRGIGEAAAKILAASGADVTITYAAGNVDAKRVCDEIVVGGGSCRAVQLDVREAIPADFVTSPDQIFYFASPAINVSPNAVWRSELFAQYSEFYIEGFSRVVDWAIQTRPGGAKGLFVYYPSTVFLDAPIRGSGEYCAAKAAGEAMAAVWRISRPGLSIVCPRLPRLLTDQTAAIRSASIPTADEYMLKALAELEERT